MRMDNEALNPLAKKGRRCLITMVNMDRVVNREAFRATMSKV